MSFDFREEDAAGSSGAGVERRAATGARARAVTPARAGSLNKTGRAAPADGSALARRSLSPAVNGRGPHASPAETCAATLATRTKPACSG